MNKFRSIVAPEQLEKGDIIRFKTQGTAMERRDNPWGQGYVHSIEYASQKDDTVTAIRLLPIVPSEQAAKHDFSIMAFNSAEVGDLLGLNVNQTWAALLAPLTILPTSEYLGYKDDVVQRLGNIAHTEQETRLLERLDASGGSLYGAPSEARPSASSWGLYIPVGVRKDRFEEREYVEQPKRQYKKKPAFEGKVIDLDLDLAVEKLGLPEDIAKLLQSPAEKRAKPITTLRDAQALNAESLRRYIPKETGLMENPMLEELTSVVIDGETYYEVEEGIVDSLKTPREGEDVKPILDLKSAYELVTQRPNDLLKYFGMGKKRQQTAIADITEAYNDRSAAIAPEEKLAEVSSALKTAWTSFTGAYMSYLDSKEVPENLRDADGKPVWKMVPKTP